MSPQMQLDFVWLPVHFDVNICSSVFLSITFFLSEYFVFMEGELWIHDVVKLMLPAGPYVLTI